MNRAMILSYGAVVAMLAAWAMPATCMRSVDDQELTHVVGGASVGGPCNSVDGGDPGRPPQCGSTPCTSTPPPAPISGGGYDCFRRTQVAYHHCASPGTPGSCVQTSKECSRWWGFDRVTSAFCHQPTPLGQCDPCENPPLGSQYDPNGCTP